MISSWLCFSTLSFFHIPIKWNTECHHWCWFKSPHPHWPIFQHISTRICLKKPTKVNSNSPDKLYETSPSWNTAIAAIVTTVTERHHSSDYPSVSDDISNQIFTIKKQNIKKLSGWWFQPTLWKIWVRQLGWWHSQLNGKSLKNCSKPPISYQCLFLSR